MSKYFVMGKYTPKAFHVINKNPNQDRTDDVKALTGAVGG